MLRSGVVYSGAIRQAAGDDDAVHLQTARGPVVLARASIEAQGPTIQAVYTQLAADACTEERHAALGRWCMRQGLFSQAAEQFDQLNAAMRSRAMDELDAERTELEQNATAAASSRSPQPHVDDARTVGPQVMREYQRRVRPLLLNGCANARCHGAASGQSLRFARGSRRDEMATIESLLTYIDAADPGNSRLLDYARRPHGGAASLATDPRRYPDRYERLRAWVATAATVDATLLTAKPSGSAPADAVPPRFRPVSYERDATPGVLQSQVDVSSR